MSKYFMDCEFLEGKQDKRFLGIKYGETKPTIDLISIGLVDENGREFYAISKDFNLKEAWNRYDLLEANTNKNHSLNDVRVYWIRENVLRPIWLEYIGGIHKEELYPFTYKNMKNIIEKNGKSKREIANDICAFIYGDDCGGSGEGAIEMAMKYEISDKSLEPEFYAYYASYDWVAFCWIFGKMIQLPKGFPMYCKDLKQIMDDNGLGKEWKRINCPDPIGEHNALVDAKWNLKLFNALNRVKG